MYVLLRIPVLFTPCLYSMHVCTPSHTCTLYFVSILPTCMYSFAYLYSLLRVYTPYMYALFRIPALFIGRTDLLLSLYMTSLFLGYFTSFHIFSSSFLAVLLRFSIFHSCCSRMRNEPLGTTLVHGYHIFYRSTAWNLLLLGGVKLNSKLNLYLIISPLGRRIKMATDGLIQFVF